MRNKVRIIGVSLASMAWLLLASGAAWAQASKTPVSGQIIRVRVTDSGEEFEDEDGIHGRNQRARFRYVGDIAGRLFEVGDFNVDLLTGDQQVRGFFSFVGQVLGELVTATGHFRVKCSEVEGRDFCDANRVWHLSDGGLMKTTWTGVIGDLPFDYVGIIHDNPGGN